MKNVSLKGLAGLGQLSGLVVTPCSPQDAAAVQAAENLKALALESAIKSQRAKDVVRVHRETKGRGGKAVSLVRGVTLPLAELEALGKQLKTACGSGGTVKDGVIEVQGDHGDRLVELLKAQGFNAKRAGA
jgi:translation initiation factor 1